MRACSHLALIYLDKGDEDKRLYDEINKVVADLGLSSTYEFLVRYPVLYDLRNLLKNELGI